MREAGIPYRAIYRNTTIDPPGTIRHAREMGAEERKPEQTFFELIAKNGLPNSRYRFCCRVLKEFKILDKVVMGVRKSESVKRTLRYQDPTECKFYGTRRREHVEAIYPILDWTDQDVEDFIADRGIRCAPIYYDEEGKFHVERRLGCIGCPLQYNKKRIAAFHQYPRMVRAYLRAAKRWWDDPRHDNSSMKRRYSDIYEWFVRDLFYYKTQYFERDKASANGPIDYKAKLENEFGIDLTF